MQNEADVQETATRPMLVFTGALHANALRAVAATLASLVTTAGPVAPPLSVPATTTPGPAGRGAARAVAPVISEAAVVATTEPTARTCRKRALTRV
jgi:hypothetical protein